MFSCQVQRCALLEILVRHPHGVSAAEEKLAGVIPDGSGLDQMKANTASVEPYKSRKRWPPLAPWLQSVQE